MTDEREPAGPEAWDRIGTFLGYVGEVGQAMSQRNLQVWSEVSEHLRSGRYTANDMASDTARVMAAAIDNLQDAWDLWTRIPDRQAVAQSVPTVFLYFEYVPAPGGGGQYTLPDGTYIRLPPNIRSAPQRAQIALAGPEAGAAKTLSRSIAAQLQPRQRGYWLAPYKPATDLTPGVYTGLVYIRLGTFEAPLADLRVVVEEPAEAADEVSPEAGPG